jgi:hypothetical protein
MSPAEFLRQLWSGYRLLICIVGLLLLANLLSGLVLQQYLVPTVSEREQQLLQSQAELRGGGAGGDSPALLFAQGEKDLAVFLEKIPPHQEFTGLIVELENLADEAGLELTQVSYKNDREKDSNLLRYTLAFTVEGNYRNIKQFVHSLEQSARLIILREIGLQGVGLESENEVRLQLSLETFFRVGTP